MSEFWDYRYRDEEYAYGIEPNEFFKDHIRKMNPGKKVLFPGEGEGRNAVYAARLGFEAYAFDPSVEGKKKARLLAQKYNVSVDYKVESYETIDYPEAFFDAVVLIFAHMHPQKRKLSHQKMIKYLAPGGKLILEGFSKEQLKYGTGGPPDVNVLFSEEELKSDFESLQLEFMEKKVTTLDEGSYHQGEASVIRCIFVK